jgi:hypothetical protein
MALADELERTPVRGRSPAADPRRSRRRRVLLVAAWFVAVAIYVTWPLVLHLGDRIPYGLTDPLEISWIFGWAAHAIVHQPAHLFDGNIYFPQLHTLAFTENMLGLSLPTAPLFWLTGSAIVQVNVASLLVLVTAGLGVYLLVHELTGDWRAALVAGTAYEVVPYRIGQFAHLHVAGNLLPWALFLLVVLGRRPRWSTAGVLAFIIGLQFWSSLTGGVVMLALCGAWVLWALLTRRREAGPLVLRSVAAIAVGVAVAVPVFLPYLQVRRNNPEFAHPPEEAIFYSATPQSYLYTPAARGPVVDRVYESMDQTFQDHKGWWEKTLWPGAFGFFGFAAAIVAAIVASVASRRRGARWRQPFAALAFAGLTAAVLSFGPNNGADPKGFPLPFMIVTKLVPAGLMRVPARFGIAAALCAIAATSVAIAAIPRRGLRNGLLLASLAVVLVEAMPPILPLSVPPERTAAHAAIADRPGAVLALPTTEYDAARDTVNQPTTMYDAQHMYLSTANFRPMVNGYAAFGPRSYWSTIADIQDFPSARGFESMRRRGVSTVVVQTDLVVGTKWRDVVPRLDAWPGVHRLAVGKNTVVYDITGAR